MVFTKLNKVLASRPKFIPTPDEITLLNRALAAAAQSEQRFRVGAASVYGYNYNTKTAHAEARLDFKSVADGLGDVVAVARLGRKHDWRCSYPCPDCQQSLVAAGARRLVCFDENGHPVSLSLAV